MPKNKQETASSYDYRQTHKNRLFLAIATAVIVGASVFAILYFSNNKPLDDMKTTQTDSSNRSSKTDDSQKVTPSSETPNPEQSQDKTPSQYDGDDPNQSQSITGFLSTARFSADKLVLRVTIDQYLSNGTCNLNISDGSNSLEKSAQLVPVVSTSSCEGFDIPTGELSNFSRPLHITINVASDNKTGIIEGDIE